MISVFYQQIILSTFIGTPMLFYNICLKKPKKDFKTHFCTAKKLWYLKTTTTEEKIMTMT